MTPQEFVEKYGRMFSPSGSGRWLYCPGSVALERTIKERYPERRELPNVYASLGTVAHKLGATCITRDVSPYSYIGETMTADDETDFAYKIDLEMANAVNVYVDYVFDNIRDRDVLFHIEETLDLTGISPYIRSGTSDCWIYNRETKWLYVFDYKNGRGYVEVKRNTQLMIYALGVLIYLLKHHGIKATDIAGITLSIIQPRERDGAEPIRSWDTTVEALSWFYEFVLSSIRSAVSQNPHFAPTEDRCKYCPGKDLCTARADDALKSAKLDFQHLVAHGHSELHGVEPSIETMMYADTPEPSLPIVDLLSINEIAYILKWEDRVKRFFSDLGARALAHRLEGNVLPFFKLVRGRSIRQWKNESDAIKVCNRLALDSEDIYTEPKLKSPAQIEQVLKKKKIDASILESVIYKPPGDIKLASVADKRPEIDPKTLAHHDFAEFKQLSVNNDDM